jgi:peptidyl-prolyl cis-trans isomerase SurA
MAAAGAALHAFTPAPLQAQDTLRIVAVVNEDIISAYDLNARINLVTVVSNFPNTPEVRRRLAPQILRALIDDKLKLQEAKRLNVKVGKEEIERAMAQVEQQNGMPRGGLENMLQRAGVRMLTLIDQLEAEIAWGKTVSQRYRNTVRVTEEEIDEVLAQMEASKGKPEYLVAEIFLPVDDPAREREAASLAERLIQQLREGAAFPALARNFSQSASAAVGGDLGWVRSGQLAAELERVFAALEPGQVSQPVRTPTGFHILTLRSRRVPQADEAANQMVSLHQLVLSLPADARPEQVAGRVERAKSLAGGARSCADMENLAKTTGSPLSGTLGKVRLGSLPQEIRAVVSSLEVSTPSPPIRTGEGIVVLMVCERGPESSPSAERERIQRRLVNERLGTLAHQYLRDLRRAAVVDIRQ